MFPTLSWIVSTKDSGVGFSVDLMMKRGPSSTIWVVRSAANVTESTPCSQYDRSEAEPTTCNLARATLASVAKLQLSETKKRGGD